MRKLKQTTNIAEIDNFAGWDGLGGLHWVLQERGGHLCMRRRYISALLTFPTLGQSAVHIFLWLPCVSKCAFLRWSLRSQYNL